MSTYEQTNKFSQSIIGYEFSTWKQMLPGLTFKAFTSYYRLLMSDSTTSHYEAESDPEC